MTFFDTHPLTWEVARRITRSLFEEESVEEIRPTVSQMNSSQIRYERNLVSAERNRQPYMRDYPSNPKQDYVKTRSYGSDRFAEYRG